MVCFDGEENCFPFFPQNIRLSKPVEQFFTETVASNDDTETSFACYTSTLIAPCSHSSMCIMLRSVASGHASVVLELLVAVPAQAVEQCRLLSKSIVPVDLWLILLLSGHVSLHC